MNKENRDLIGTKIKQKSDNSSGNLISNSRLSLIKCQLNGAKDFIFSYNSTLEESLYLGNYFNFLLLAIKNYCLSRFGTDVSKILFENSTGFTLLVSPSLTFIIDECRVHINTVLARAFKGNIYFTAVFEIFDINSGILEVSESIHCKWKSILKKQEEELNNRFLEINYRNIFKPYQDISPVFFAGIRKIDGIYRTILSDKPNLRKFNPKAKESNIPKKYTSCFSVLYSFDYQPKKVKVCRTQNSMKTVRQLPHSLSGNDLLLSNIHDSSIIMEISLINPDLSFCNINRELNLVELIDYYEKYKQIEEEILSYFSAERNNKNYSSAEKGIHLVYQSDTDLIFAGKLKELLNILIFFLDRLKGEKSQHEEISAYIKIEEVKNNLSFNKEFDNFLKTKKGINSKTKCSCYVKFFDEEFNQQEFAKIIELIKLFINLLKEEGLDIHKQNLIMKRIYRSSLLFNKLIEDSTDGCLYLKEIIKFKYYLGGLLGINDTINKRLLQIFEDILLRNLIGNFKFSNKMILPSAFKAAYLIVNNKQFSSSLN